MQGDVYIISEKCNKGSIGFSNAFERSGNDLNLDIGGSYKLENGKLTRTFQGAVNVFNASFSEVIETKDLILTYSRQ